MDFIDLGKSLEAKISRINIQHIIKIKTTSIIFIIFSKTDIKNKGNNSIKWSGYLHKDIIIWIGHVSAKKTRSIEKKSILITKVIHVRT
jgi:hypothetical protein